MARIPKVAISFEFDRALVYIRREEAPNAKYDSIGRTWKAPSLEAAAFVARADREMKKAGRTATVRIDCRPVVLGLPATDVPVPVDAPAIQPSI